eukprot:GFUD01025008.1.p1 GENE.GFUD01025008.1~~GFUD01025008.1.p1  ORF type:complete len:291 (-),score=62.41 GFUD01025008.1:245-1117(-)
MIEGRVEGLAVIGAGLSRTGTLSTRAALELLLGGPCYHGAVPIVEQPEHGEIWKEAFVTGSLDPVLKGGVLKGFRAGVDYPFNCWYKELLVLHPSAKVLLTVREPKQWVASIRFIHATMCSLATSFPYSSFLYLMGVLNVDFIKFALEDSNGQSGELSEAIRGTEDQGVDFFNAHIQQVMSIVPPDQLLLFDVKDGWEPLCKFLDLPTPDMPFPHINDKRQVQLMYNTVRCVAWASLLGLPLLLSLAISMFPTDWTGILVTVTLAAAVWLVWVARQALWTQTTQKARKLQ